MQLLKWNHMSLCTDESFRLDCVGTKMSRVRFWDLSWFSELNIRYVWFRPHKADTRVVWISEVGRLSFRKVNICSWEWYLRLSWEGHQNPRSIPLSSLDRIIYIFRCVGLVPYYIVLPSNLANLHSVLHVSQMRKYMVDPSHVITPYDVQFKENRCFKVPLMGIGVTSVIYLQGKEMSLVKVIWNRSIGDVMWEQEDQMRELYPSFFFFFLPTSFENETIWRELRW